MVWGKVALAPCTGGKGKREAGANQMSGKREGERHCKGIVREREHEGMRMDPSHSSSRDEGEGTIFPLDNG